MANYFWLPYYDDEWNQFLETRTGMKHLAKMLPYANGSYNIVGVTTVEGHGVDYRTQFIEKNNALDHGMATWRELTDGDTLQIAAHGLKYSSASVAWKCPGGIVKWTAEQMAGVLQTLVPPAEIHYEVLACFGANRFAVVSSFGEKLAGAMRANGMRGSLTAFRGATNIGPGQGHQTGKSRITAGLYILRHGRANALGELSTESKVQWQLR